MKAGNRTGLTVRFIRDVEAPGLYSDGQTLYLRVWPSGSKSWIQRITIRGKQTDIGLGPFPTVSLAKTRDIALDNRRQVRAGIDPLAEKRRASVPTFQQAAEQTLDARRARWRNGKTEKIWTGVLAKYAFPAIGTTPVSEVTREDVL